MIKNLVALFLPAVMMNTGGMSSREYRRGMAPKEKGHAKLRANRKAERINKRNGRRNNK